MDNALQRGFKIGDYQILPLEGRFIGPAGSQHVMPKAMEILQCLAENPGELVERAVLIERGWGDTDVSDDVLTRCISELRHHLDDHDPFHYIQTIPKRGYRLVADVVPDTSSEASASANHPSVIATFWNDLKRRNVLRVCIAYFISAWLLLQVGELIFQALQLPNWTLTLLLALLALGFPVAVIAAWVFEITPAGIVLDINGDKNGKVIKRRNLDIVIIGALVIVVGVLGYQAFFSETSVSERTQTSVLPAQLPSNSIAVLRFLNIGGEPHFADGLGEELLDRLAKLRELGVAARTSSWALSNKDVDIPTIANQLDVNYVLEGSVRQAGDQIRITAQLNNGKTGKHVWSHSYDRELTTANFFNIQTEIARQVVELLKVSLSPESEARLAGKPETSMEALNFYLQGQEYFRKPHSDESLDMAATFFNRSLEVDPRFAMAHAGLCDTELGRYIITRDVIVFEKAERACHRALTLNDDMPRVLGALGGLYLFSGQNAKAETELRAAISANPNLIDAYADLGEALENQGFLNQAEETFRAMVARQPGYWYAHNALGNFLYRQSRFDEAAQSWERVTRLAPDRALGYNNVATAYYMMGDFEAASRSYEISVQIEPYVDNYSNLGLAYFYDGRYLEAAEMQIKASELRPDDARVLGRLAAAYQFGGREEDATAVYHDAIELLRKQLIINPDDIRLIRYFAVYNASIGQVDQAQDALAHALELQPESSGVRFDAAKIALADGDTDQALDYLKQARDLGYSVNIIRSDPVFTPLHEDTQFMRVAQKDD